VLGRESRDAWEAGAFRRARVGRGPAQQIREEIRTDHVLWLEPELVTAAQRAYLDRIEALRVAINSRLFLGLFEFEGHFAVYPEGGFYRAHLDRHRQTQDRVVSVILYLNEDWRPGDGGELKLWTTAGRQEGRFELIEPRLGTLVCFLSGDYWHEVLPAARSRMSITGWYLVRGG
jgi:SM-20-related protein